jgi:DnaJ-class molecular chaperone
MLIELAVETPVNLTARQKELLREFEKLSENNNPEGSSFFRQGEELLGRDEGLKCGLGTRAHFFK